jgi:hypothetical protein
MHGVNYVVKVQYTFMQLNSKFLETAVFKVFVFVVYISGTVQSSYLVGI